MADLTWDSYITGLLPTFEQYSDSQLDAEVQAGNVNPNLASMIKAARGPRPDATGQQQTGGSATDPNSQLDAVLVRFRNSQGTEADRNVLYQALRNMGMDPNAALERLNREVAAKTGTGTNVPPLTNVPTPSVTKVSPPETSFVSPEERRRQELSASREGRGQLFNENLAFQPWAPEITRRQQREAFAPYQNLYEIGRGLGDIGNADTFDRYLQGGITGRPDPSYYRGQLERVAALLEGGDQSNAVTQAFLEGLRKNRPRQAGYIYEGLEPNVPFEFRGDVKRIGGQRFGLSGDIQDIQRGLGQGTGGNPFREYMNQGVGFAGPDRAEYGSTVNATADFLSRPGTGEKDIQAAFREQLQEDQPRQFGLAQESQRRSIPWELRDIWDKIATDAFYRWSSKAPAGANFLPYAQSRGYQFAGM